MNIKETLYLIKAHPSSIGFSNGLLSPGRIQKISSQFTTSDDGTNLALRSGSFMSLSSGNIGLMILL